MIWLTVAEVEDSGGVRALADRAALEARKQVWRDCLAAYEDHHTPQAYAKIIAMLRRKLGLKQSVEGSVKATPLSVLGVTVSATRTVRLNSTHPSPVAWKLMWTPSISVQRGRRASSKAPPSESQKVKAGKDLIARCYPCLQA
jgi:hypothetical protein